METGDQEFHIIVRLNYVSLYTFQGIVSERKGFES